MSAEHPYIDWIGRERSAEDVVSLDRVRKLAATLDLDPDAFQTGDPLPRGWHWIHHHEHARRSALADDGHEERGDFLPPISLERRMWAGGRLRFIRQPRIGSEVHRRSTIRSIDLKEGRSGPLAFVTVEHRLSDRDGILIEEEQDIVYLNRLPDERSSRSDGDSGRVRPGAGAGAGRAGSGAEWKETIALDEVTLFRFSALTFNGHRIHYDRPYAVEVEKYPGLVVHGPLLAMLLLSAGARWVGADDRITSQAPGTQSPPSIVPVRFSYRSLGPVFCNEGVAMCGAASPGAGSERRAHLWIEHPTRGAAMRAELQVAD